VDNLQLPFIGPTLGGMKDNLVADLEQALAKI
jgi:hypothetical protein